MKISLNWLHDYLTYSDVSVEEMSSILTSIGLEVEGVEKVDSIKGGLEKYYIGEVLECEKHPNADRLKLTKVNLGDLGLKNIVCGAPNVAAGQKVVVAAEGAVIHLKNGESFTIKKSKIRGEESNGMICAEDELGLGDDHDGILVLDDSALPGMSAADYFKVESDTIFEIGLTPNRTDAMHHKGVARDLAIAMQSRDIDCEFHPDGKLNLPEVSYGKPSSMSIDLKTEKASKFGGAVIEKIESQSSPDWLKNRLKAIGESPKSLLVDVTNYILHDLGQPLHAYDLSKISGNRIVVEENTSKQELEVLNGDKLKLEDGDIIIRDDEKIIGLAGIMGSMSSAVDDSTHSIYLEGAYFDAISIRRSSQRLGLRSEAAIKFEKGIDPNGTNYAIDKAIRILANSNSNLLSSDIQMETKRDFEFWQTSLSRKKLDIYSNIQIERDRVELILKGLGIEILDYIDGAWNLKVPRFKEDVKREEDVIEEVLRIYGYNHLPYPKYLRSNLSFTEGLSSNQFEVSVIDFLTGRGLQEIITNSISQSKYYAKEETPIRLLNSMTSELDSMRLSILPSILEVFEYNMNRGNNDLSVFEMGSVYTKTAKYSQNRKICIGITGMLEKPNWKSTNGIPNDYFYLKSLVEGIGQRFDWDFEYKNTEERHLHYGLDVILDQKNIGSFGEVKVDKKLFDLKQKVFYAELDFDYLFSISKKQKINFQEPSKFLPVRRDLALVVDAEVSFADIESKCYKALGSILTNVNLFDIYKDASLGENKKSYAIRLQLLNRDKTMSDKEIDKLIQRLIQKLQKEIGAEIRS